MKDTNAVKIRRDLAECRYLDALTFQQKTYAQGWKDALEWVLDGNN